MSTTPRNVSRANSSRPASPPKAPEPAETSISRSILDEKQAGSARQFHDVLIHVEFKVMADQARSVSVAGTFNQWDTNQTPLTKNGDHWTATLMLPRGEYEYRFYMDGYWVADPCALDSVANPFGGLNSVLTV